MLFVNILKKNADAELAFFKKLLLVLTLQLYRLLTVHQTESRKRMVFSSRGISQREFDRRDETSFYKNRTSANYFLNNTTEKRLVNFSYWRSYGSSWQMLPRMVAQLGGLCHGASCRFSAVTRRCHVIFVV